MEAQHFLKLSQWEFKMETIDAIKERRSIRHFNSEEVSVNNLKEIIEAGILAPSAHNKQPWHFIVVKDKDIKNKLSLMLKEKVEEAALTAEVIETCNTLILVFAEIQDELMDIQSVGASIENMILMATAKNIGSLWIGYIAKIEGELQELFKTDKKLIAAVALGKASVAPKPRPRKNVDEVVEWY